MGRVRKFEDDFDELTFYLGKLFNQKQSLINSTQLQRRAQAILKLDRYNVISHNNKPKYVVIDARLMDKIRKVMVNMDYIKDKPVYGETLPDLKELPKPKPDKITFHLEESQEDVQS